MAFKKFKIIKDSIVKGTGRGVLYCETIPEHPDAKKLKDRDRKYIEVHRVVMENQLGRLINPKKEEVHHKDENPGNNAPSNLELTQKAKHQRNHALKEKRWEKTKFWKKSPRTKPGQTRKVAQAYLDLLHSPNP
jgi:hypothetical protein